LIYIGADRRGDIRSVCSETVVLYSVASNHILLFVVYLFILSFFHLFCVSCCVSFFLSLYISLFLSLWHCFFVLC
jgi:hypothetical protein